MRRSLRRPALLALFGIVPLLLALAPQTVLAASARSDVSIRLVADRTHVRPGQQITYRATMTNRGPNDATLVDTVFTWPGRLQPLAMTCDRGISPDTPNCEYLTLKAGESVVSVFKATPLTGARRGGSKVTVTARVSFEVDCRFDPTCTFDPNMRNDASSVTTTLR